MSALGHFRFALRPGADAAAFEALMAAVDSENVLQLTRVTSAFEERLFEVVRPEGEYGSTGTPDTEYLWEVTVRLVSGGHRYDFAENAGRVQEAVGDLATLVSVEAFRPVRPLD